MFVEMRHDSNLVLSSTRSQKRRNVRVEASLPEASPLDNIDFRTFFNYLYTLIKSKLIMQSAVKTNMSDVGRHVWPPYPVEELFKLLDEQLHSAGLHRSAERAVEELHRNVETPLEKRFICITQASFLKTEGV